MVAVGIDHFSRSDNPGPVELLKIDAQSCRNLAGEFPDDADFLGRLPKASKLVVDTNDSQIIIPKVGSQPAVSINEARFKRIFPTNLPYMWVALALSGKNVEVHHATLLEEDFSLTQTTYHRALEEGLRSLGPKHRQKAGTITFVWEKTAPPSP